MTSSELAAKEHKDRKKIRIKGFAFLAFSRNPFAFRHWDFFRHSSFVIRHSKLTAVCLCMLAVPGLAAPSTNATDSRDFSSFKIIADRNIFNSRRSPRYVPSDRRETRRTTRSESFALVGTMTYDKGPFAFFEGSRSEYRKVLKPADTIAGFKIASIEASSVKLASPTNEIELPIGKQLRREEEGEWHMSARTESIESTTSRQTSQNTASVSDSNIQNGNGAPSVAEGTPAGADPSAPAASTQRPATGGDADVLERLRRRAAAERGE